MLYLKGKCECSLFYVINTINTSYNWVLFIHYASKQLVNWDTIRNKNYMYFLEGISLQFNNPSFLGQKYTFFVMGMYIWDLKTSFFFCAETTG